MDNFDIDNKIRKLNEEIPKNKNTKYSEGL